MSPQTLEGGGFQPHLPGLSYCVSLVNAPLGTVLSRLPFLQLGGSPTMNLHVLPAAIKSRAMGLWSCHAVLRIVTQSLGPKRPEPSEAAAVLLGVSESLGCHCVQEHTDPLGTRKNSKPPKYYLNQQGAPGFHGCQAAPGSLSGGKPCDARDLRKILRVQSIS